MATVETMTAAIEKCAEHLRGLPNVVVVVADKQSGFLGSKLPAIMLDEVTISSATPFTGATTYLKLRWIIVVLASTKREVRRLLAVIRNMYRKNTSDSATRFNDLHELGVAYVGVNPDAPGDYELVSDGAQITAVHGVVELDVTYMEVSA